MFGVQVFNYGLPDKDRPCGAWSILEPVVYFNIPAVLQVQFDSYFWFFRHL